MFYKGGRRLPELARRADRCGRSGSAVAGELIGMPGERIGTLRDLSANGPASYLATVIIPAAPPGLPTPGLAWTAAAGRPRARSTRPADAGDGTTR